MFATLELTPTERHFLPQDFKVENWDKIKPFYEELKNRPISSKQELFKWFKDRSELEAILSEDMGWRYIRMTGDTSNKSFTDAFNYFVTEIEPHIAPYSNALDEKAFKSPFIDDLKKEGLGIVIRNIEKDLKIFREKNIPLLTELNQEQQRYGAISGAMTVEIDGKEITLPQASDFLQSSDRSVRESVYKKIAQRRYQDKDQLDELFSHLIKLRNQVAVNADFKNYRDYMFTAMGRFDYAPKDCFEFHEAVQLEVVPVLNELAKERKTALGVKELRPWDANVNYFGDKPLKPFETGEELLNKSIAIFDKLDPYLGKCLSTMKKMGHLDLESRKGKAPGGYNYPLDEVGVPFIFMNATSSLRDLVTMVHEGGHAIHNFVTRDLELGFFKHPPSEVAELASMSMELISMTYWDAFFKDQRDLNRAKREHLEGIIQTLPWVATVDKFQHWVYENPNHSLNQRKNEWSKIYSQFSNNQTDWSGLEQYKEYLWQKQLHIYEVPFYYIEYGMAQLGAIAVWKNCIENPKKGLELYLNALRLGYTKPIGEIYKAAGVKFDFSKEYIKELISFTKEQLYSIKL
jgi:oligoendopeptidase F